MGTLNLNDAVEKVKTALIPTQLFALGRSHCFVYWRRDIPTELLAPSLIGSLATNLNPKRFSCEAVRALYRLRWQVELLFKERKAYANLHKFQNEKAPIVEGLV